MSLWKKLQDVHTLFTKLQCGILHDLQIKKKDENKNVTTKDTALLPAEAGIHHTSIALETKQGQKGYFIVHTALSEEENLPWSGMDLCNVIQNEHVDEKDWFCIVGWTLSWWHWAKPEYTCRTRDRKDSNPFLISLIMWFLDLSINLFQKEIKLKETILTVFTVSFMGSQ